MNKKVLSANNVVSHSSFVLKYEIQSSNPSHISVPFSHPSISPDSVKYPGQYHDLSEIGFSISSINPQSFEIMR